MDILDIYRGRFFQLHAGKYFERLPENITFLRTVEDLGKVEEGLDFDFEFVDATSWRYKQLFSNVTESEYGGATIKSNEDLPWKAKGFVLLDNGRLYVITQVTEDTDAVPREAARIFPVPVGTDYVLRLVEVENNVQA